jgi:tRNA threonylcarbamoyladenosine biosynthesis protein TsaB
MTGLIIDTSGPWLNMALCREGKVLATVVQEAGNRQAERLPSELDNLLVSARLKLSEINWLAVTVGPGSFTGLRVGISFAQGLAMGGELDLIPLNTLDAMASMPEGFLGQMSPMLDAKKGQVYTARYRAEGGPTQIMTEYRVTDPETWLSGLPPKTKVFGSGAAAYREMILQAYPELQLDDSFGNGPEIGGLVKLTLESLKKEKFVRPGDLDAFYIRPSDAEARPDA